MISISATIPSPSNRSAGILAVQPAATVHIGESALVDALRPYLVKKPHPLDHLASGAAQVHGVPAGAGRGRDLHDGRREAVPRQPERERRAGDAGARDQYRPCCHHLRRCTASYTYAYAAPGLIDSTVRMCT